MTISAGIEKALELQWVAGQGRAVSATLLLRLDTGALITMIIGAE